MDDFWNILELEPTTDKNLIKKTYMEKLNIYHPEDDPEGFQNLRDAYEKALSYDPDSIVFDNSEVGIFIKKVEDLYFDFKKKIELDNWIDLFKDSSLRIDTEEEILEKMLDFFMDNYLLPKKVWLFLIDHFALEEKEKELKGKFPERFIDYILEYKIYDDLIRFDMFDFNFKPDENKDYDAFIKHCHKINSEFSNYDQEIVEDLINKIDSFNIYNADALIIKNRSYIYSKKLEQAKILMDELNEQWPEDYKILFERGQVYLNLKDYDKALELFNNAIKQYPIHVGALTGIADCYFGLGDFVKAKELYRQRIKENPYNNYLRDIFFTCNEKLIEYYNDVLDNDKKIFDENNNELSLYDKKYKLAVSYFNVYKYLECKTILLELNPDEDKKYDYYDLISDTCHQLEEFEEALKYVQEWKKIGKITDQMIRQEVDSLYAAKKYDETISLCEKYCKIYPNIEEFFSLRCLILNKIEKYEEVVTIAEEGLEINRNNLSLWLSLAKAQHILGHYAEALDACNMALEIYPCIQEIFIIQLKIYYDVDDFDSVLVVAETCDKYELEDTEIDFYKACALRYKGNLNDAKEILINSVEKKDSDPKLFYELSRIYADEQDFKKAIENIKKSIELAPENTYSYLLLARYQRLNTDYDDSLKNYNKVIDENPKFLSYAYYERGILYNDLDKTDLAISDFLLSIETDPENSKAYGSIADIYKDKKEFEKAIEFYTKQIEIYESPYLYVTRGICYGEINQIDNEVNDYLKTIEEFPNYAWSYNNLGYVYLFEKKDIEKATEYYKIAIEKDEFMFASYRYLAIIEKRKRNQEAALIIYNKAIEVFGREGQVLNDKLFFMSQKGSYLLELGRFGEAKIVFEEILKIDVGNARIYDDYVICLINTKKLIKAEEILKKGIELFPNSHYLYDSFGDLERVVKKHYNKAIELYQKSLNIDFSAFANIKIGQCYEMLKKYSHAEASFKKAIEIIEETLKTESAEPCDFVKLGDAYLGLLDYESALKYFNLAIQEFNNYDYCYKLGCEEAYFGLGRLYEKKGDIIKALEYYKKTIEISPDYEYIEAKNNMLDAKERSIFKKITDIFKK